MALIPSAMDRWVFPVPGSPINAMFSFLRINSQVRRLKGENPVIEGFLAWLKQADPGSNGRLKKAITYIRNREDFLMTYLEDGRCNFSNNLSENSIHPVTVGRKNWLFSDSPESAQANTLYLTIVEMARAYGLDLYKCLISCLNKGLTGICQMKDSKNWLRGMKV